MVVGTLKISLDRLVSRSSRKATVAKTVLIHLQGSYKNGLSVYSHITTTYNAPKQMSATLLLHAYIVTWSKMPLLRPRAL